MAEFEVGDKVALTMDLGSGLIAGLEGVVIGISLRNTISVYFAGWNNGHEGSFRPHNEECPEEQKYSCYHLSEGELTLISTKDGKKLPKYTIWR